MSDRERLEALALANEQKRRDEESAHKQMEAENAQRQLQQNASDEEQPKQSSIIAIGVPGLQAEAYRTRCHSR